MDRGERNTTIFTIVVILVFVSLYAITTLLEKDKIVDDNKPTKTSDNCIKLDEKLEFKSEDNKFTLKIEDKEYPVNESMGELIYIANNYNEVEVKACIENESVTGYEIIDKETNKAINAKDLDEFLVAIGYYKMGNHTDNLTYKGLVEQYDAELEPEFEGMAPMPYKCYVMLFENSKGKELKIVNRDFSGLFTENYQFVEGEKYNVIFGMEKLKTHEIQFWYLDLAH